MVFIVKQLLYLKNLYYTEIPINIYFINIKILIIRYISYVIVKKNYLFINLEFELFWAINKKYPIII